MYHRAMSEVRQQLSLSNNDRWAGEKSPKPKILLGMFAVWKAQYPSYRCWKSVSKALFGLWEPSQIQATKSV